MQKLDFVIPIIIGILVFYLILKDYIARCVECDFLPLIPDGTMYEINQYREYVDLNIVLTRKELLRRSEQ